MKMLRLIKNGILTVLAKQTVGARALVIEENKVLLVKHTYQPQWYTIGGAVDKGEMPLQTLQRELNEEVGAVDITAKLFNVYYSHNEKHDDYIVFYIVQVHKFVKVDSPEIAQMQWFDLQQLPLDISPATQRRIDEYLGRSMFTGKW